MKLNFITPLLLGASLLTLTATVSGADAEDSPGFGRQAAAHKTVIATNPLSLDTALKKIWSSKTREGNTTLFPITYSMLKDVKDIVLSKKTDLGYYVSLSKPSVDNLLNLACVALFIESHKDSSVSPGENIIFDSKLGAFISSSDEGDTITLKLSDVLDAYAGFKASLAVETFPKNLHEYSSLYSMIALGLEKSGQKFNFITTNTKNVSYCLLRLNPLTNKYEIPVYSDIAERDAWLTKAMTTAGESIPNRFGNDIDLFGLPGIFSKYTANLDSAALTHYAISHSQEKPYDFVLIRIERLMALLDDIEMFFNNQDATFNDINNGIEISKAGISISQSNGLFKIEPSVLTAVKVLKFARDLARDLNLNGVNW